MDLFSADPYCLHVSSIHVRGLHALKWTGKNDPYVRLSIGDWSFETPVVWNAPENIDWDDLKIVGLTSGGSELLVELINANVVRENELIGSATHPIGDMCVGSKEEILLDIHEQDKKQRKRCRIDINVMLKVSDPSKITSGPNDHNLKKTQSRREQHVHNVEVNKSPPPKAQCAPPPPDKHLSPSNDKSGQGQSHAHVRFRPQAAAPEAKGAECARDWREGDRVEVRYRGKSKFYPATIGRVRMHGTYDIDYDDGEKETAVEPELIRGLPAAADRKEKRAFKSGDQVEARQLGRTRYFPGVVERVNRDGSYDVKYDDGEAERGVQSDMVRAVGSASRKRGTSKDRPRFDQEEPVHADFKVGDRVMARYQGKDSYVPGKITRSRMGGKAFDIDYDNGDNAKGVKNHMIRAVPVHSVSLRNDLKVSDRVQARYKGRSKYYPGVITRVRKDGSCDITYDDGEKETCVERDFVKAVDGMNKTDDGGVWFKIGDRVEARFKGLVKYYPGVISRVLINRTYHIDYDDGEKELGVPHEMVRSLALPHDKSDKMDVSLEGFLTPSACDKKSGRGAPRDKEPFSADATATDNKPQNPKKISQQRSTEADAKKGKESGVAEEKMSRTKSKKKVKVGRKGSSAVTETIEEFQGFDFKDIDISPDTTRRVVDQAFEIALLEETSSIALKTHEVSLVLDALGIPLNAHAYDTLREDFAAEEYGYADTETTAGSSGKDVVLLSLRSPALLAAVMTEYANDKNLVATNKMSLARGHFSLSEMQAITAMKHLISLIHGVWKKARRTILSLSESSHGGGDVRPSFWAHGAVADFATILQLPRGKFDAFTGEDFINLNNSTISALIKPSILQCRCRLYSQVMRHLDEWWDRSMRPRDPISKSFSPTKHLETNVGVLSPHRKVNYMDSADAPFKKGSHVKISLHERLLRAYMPIHRAYAWSVSPEDMTALCSLLGGAEGSVASPPFEHTSRKLNGMQWVSLIDKPCTHKNNDSTLLTALRDFDGKNDIVSGRNVYIPSSCLKACESPVESKPPVQKSLADIPVDEVVMDMPVRVDNLDMICRAYERFEWWDRPSSTVLMSIANRLGKVVSIEHLRETGRVGVSVPCPNSVEVVDALPIEALKYVPPTSPTEKQQKSKIMYANKTGSKIMNGNIVDGDSEAAQKIKASRKLVAAEAKYKEDGNKPKAPATYKAWTRPPLRDQWIDERDTGDDDKYEEGEEGDIGEPYGGDESAPHGAEMEADAKARYAEEDPTQDMSADNRVGKADRTFLRPDRPLYRPITANDLSTPPSSPRDRRGGTKEVSAPTYTWMRRDRKDGPDQVIKSPRVTVGNATLDDVELDRHNQGAYDPRSDYDRNVTHMTVNVMKQKTRANQLRETAPRARPVEEAPDEARTRQARGRNNEVNRGGEPNLWVSGKSFSNDQNRVQEKEYAPTDGAATSRPLSAGPNGANRTTGAANARPRSANATRKPSQYAQSKPEATMYPWMESRNTASKQDPKYNEVLWRELRRTEQETKKREAILRRQLKKMGSDDYDSYHNV
jgi:hypothetical protein